MKVLCSQEVVSPHFCGAVPCQVTAKASAPQVPWFVLYLWLQKGIQENMAWLEYIDFYAFSRGSSRKPARNLIEIAQRKSQELLWTPRLVPSTVLASIHA
jgi:hypothetical protein